VKDITGPGLSREFAEFTHQQFSGGYQEYKPAFKNCWDVTFKCNFLPDDETQGFSKLLIAGACWLSPPILKLP
jgi:hypothetical protein